MQDNKIRLPTLINYLRNKQKLEVNPKYHYDMRHVIMSLNNASIDEIKHEFQCHDNRLDLPKFIWLIKQALEKQQQEQYFMYYQLVKLFEEIDIDKSNTIEWSQFLEYISQSKWLTTLPPSEQHLNNQDTNLLFHAFQEHAKYRKHPIKRLIEIQRHNTLAIITNNHQLNFINIHQTDNNSSLFTLSNIDNARVLSLAYSEQERLFGILLTNRNLCFVEDAEIQKSHGVLRSTGTQIQIRFLPIHQLWILQNFNSTLQIFSSPKNFKLGKKMIFKPHVEPITELAEIKNPLAVCSSSLDGIIKLWHINIGKLIIELDIKKEMGCEDHKGIKGIATYNNSTLSYICSWMFTSQIFIWLPSISLSKPFYATLQGHNGLVLDCKFAWKGELISIDDKRAVKVWNLQKLQCFQNFILQSNSLSLYVLKQKPYLIIYDKLLDFYRFRTHSKVDLQSELKITKKQGRNVLIANEGQNQTKLLGVEFSEYYCFIIVITTQQIKIMNINTQKLISMIHPPNGQDFICSSMKSNRRLYAATTANEIYEYRIENGLVLNSKAVSNESQDEELKFIYYHEDIKILLCVLELQNVSMIVTYDELNNDSQRIKEIQFQQTNLLEFRVNHQFEQFYILSSDYIITIWDFQKLIILNKIDLKSYLKLSGPLKHPAFYFNKPAQSLILQTLTSIYIINITSNASVSDIHHLTFPQNITIAASTLIYNKMPLQQFSSLKKTTNFIEKDDAREQKVNFEGVSFKNEMEIYETYDFFLLSLSNHIGEISFYNISDFLKPKLPREKPTIKSKSHFIKQVRKAHVKFFQWNGKMETVDCQKKLFHEQSIFIPQIATSGEILGMFYFFTKDSCFHVLNAQGKHKGEWSIELSSPRYWTLAFNQIEEVLKRLQKTQKALSSSFYINSSKFRLQFLINKYLTQPEILSLENLQAESQVKLASMKNTTKRSLTSLYTTKSKANLANKDVLMTIIDARGSNKETHNIFQNILIQKDTKPVLNVRNNKHLFDKIQKSLSLTKHIKEQKMREKVQSAVVAESKKLSEARTSVFANHIEQIFTASTSKIAVESNLENSSIKSTKKQLVNRRQSLSNLLQLKTANESSSVFKTRVKSSLNELSKNFNQTKIELNNFKKNTQVDLLVKKGKKLKL